MDTAQHQAHNVVTPQPDIPLLKVLGVMGLCLALISSILYLGVQWIIRIGKAEHAAGLLAHQQQQQITSYLKETNG
ncbi:MAG: hypothetical protein J3R72DRAFT_519364 [Linnemannia gamsii]|nr:MAG: hypothetical protein J3R72DRAFT_519364 [Linnemannia gamsii]